MIDGTNPSRWSLPRKRILLRTLRSDPTQEYLLYIPEKGGENASMLVSVHGISRNAYEQAAAFADLCERQGYVLVVPVFTPEQHKDYQRLGRAGRGRRVDLLLHTILAEVGSLTGADVTQFRIFGFSGGAQFVHRYVMVHPQRVLAAVVAAPGWYTFPDSKQRYPFGVRPVRTMPGVQFNPEEFLRVPVTVLIGSLDTGAANLRRTDRVDKQQGVTRVERARNWTAAMRDAATIYGLEPKVELDEIPNIGHSFVDFYRQGKLIERMEKVFSSVSRTESARGSKLSRHRARLGVRTPVVPLELVH